MRNVLILLLVMFSYNCFATDYFVSSVGSDGNSGTILSPWLSISKANAAPLNPGDRVLFRSGDTFYGALVMNRSGSAGNQIIYSSYGTGAKPIITGFTTVTGWVSVGNGRYEATVSGGLSTLNIVTVNGVFQAMGRWPKITAAGKGHLKFQSHSGTSSITSNAISSALNYVGGEVAIRTIPWTIQRSVVTAQSSTTVSYTTASGGGEPRNNYGFFFQNHPNACTSLGEWSYNGSTRKITMYFGSENPSSYTVKASTVEKIFDTNNTNRSYITIDNLNITGSNKGAIWLGGTGLTGWVISSCDISYAGTDGIYVAHNSSNKITVINSAFSNINSSGITANRSTSWTIRSNSFTNIGMVPGMGTNNINSGLEQNEGSNYEGMAYIGGGSLIELNTLNNIGYLGINFRGADLLIQNNLITNFGMSKDDVSGIYTWQNAGGSTKILNNIVGNATGAWEGTSNARGQANGIYMDDNVSSVEIAYNTSFNCAMGGLYNHNAHHLNIHHNTFFDNGGNTPYTGSQTVYYNDGGTINNITYNNNIHFAKNVNQQVLTADYGGKNNPNTWFTAADNNYYCNPFGESQTFGGATSAGFFHTNLAGWRTLSGGKEVNSKITPIAISDPNKIRFEYNATSVIKAVSLGANYIDVRGVAYNGSISLAPFTSAVLLLTVGTPPPPTTTYISVAKSGAFTRNNCPAGQTGSTVTYTVTAGSYTSTVSQADADSKAQGDVTANGQGYANLNGTCSGGANKPPTVNAGTDKSVSYYTGSCANVTVTSVASDPDGVINSYAWSIAPAVPLANAISPSITVKGLTKGTYSVMVTVMDAGGLTATDQMNIIVTEKSCSFWNKLFGYCKCK